MDDLDLAWLAGLLEGEGSFLRGPPSAPARCTLRVHMTDEDVVQRAAKLFGVGHCSIPRQKPHHKDTFSATLTGTKAVDLMRILRPMMGQRRQKQITEAIASYFEHRQRKLLTEDDKAFILQGIGAGITHQAIARQLGVDRSTVSHFIKRRV